ncbi:MAG: 2-oxoacid:acceptor oxidoreductase subunit alpha [Acidimicrobiia bacterium]
MSPAQTIDSVAIRFAGDSGDGMQLTGDRFTLESAVFGNDLVTFPNFPAEIRAPAGTVAGVSSFQVHFSDHEILTPGDAPDVLVVMNPAALKANLDDLPPGRTVIVNADNFDERSLHKAEYESNPLTDGTLGDYTVFEVPMTSLTVEAAKTVGAKPRDAERSKNFFALGLVSWLYSRPIEPTLEWNRTKFSKNNLVADANEAALKAGWNYGDTTEMFTGVRYEVAPAKLEPGTYRSISGNLATSYGLIAGAEAAGLPLFLATYPITPASDILHELSRQKNFGVRTMQAEDEIAAITLAIGAAFGGHLGVTTTSGPGLDLKSEALGLAIQLEIPLVVIDVQRGGPSTGLPTKTEQADLLHAMFGRHGESPVPIVAASTPGECFDVAIEACRIAVSHMTPVILLTDGYLANGSQPWKVPDADAIERFPVTFASDVNHVAEDGSAEFWPYKRDDRLVRPWAIPGTPGLEHRIGGIEHADGTGHISYTPENHQHMIEVRAGKVACIAEDVPPLQVSGADDADVLVLGWGSTYGAIEEGVRRHNRTGGRAAHAHLRHLNPFPSNLPDVLDAYDKILVPELNSGQLAFLIQGRFVKRVRSLSKVAGVPFTAQEIAEAIESLESANEDVEELR